MKTTNDNMLKRLQRARTHLLLDHPFFGTLALKLNLVEDRSVATATTNGIHVKYNPKFIDGLNDEVLKGVMAHEVLHVTNGHTWRRGHRDPGQWNVAADHAINDIILEAGLLLPEGALKGRSGSAERIYSDLQKEEQEEQTGQTGQQPEQEPEQGPAGQGQGTETQQSPDEGNPAEPNEQGEEQGDDEGSEQGDNEAGDEDESDAPDTTDSPADSNDSDEEQGEQEEQQPEQQPIPDPGGCGAIEDAPKDEDDGGGDKLESDWKVAVAQAVTAAGMSNLPAGLQRMVEQIVDPKVPWTTALKDFVNRNARNDYDWSRANRRYVTSGIILPSLRSDELPEIVVAIDTSGSIDQETLDQFAAEVNDILTTYNTRIHILYIDAQVQDHEEVTSEDVPLQFTPKGGGGTDFRPAFQWVEENDTTPACMVYLTDMDGTFPDEEPDYPVLWAKTGDSSKDAPFGEQVSLND